MTTTTPEYLIDARARALDESTWQRWLDAGYRLWENAGSCKLNHSDSLLQKAVWRGDVKLFFVNVWVYIYDREKGFDGHPDRLAFQIYAQFNSHMDQRPTFNVTRWYYGEEPDEIEAWFLKLYDAMGCGPYGD